MSTTYTDINKLIRQAEDSLGSLQSRLKSLINGLEQVNQLNLLLEQEELSDINCTRFKAKIKNEFDVINELELEVGDFANQYSDLSRTIQNLYLEVSNHKSS